MSRRIEDISAIGGIEGMMALLRAFRDAGREFDLGVTCAVPVKGANGCFMLFTIGETTAALTLPETRWMADQLILRSAAGDDLGALGRIMLSALADAPGQHAVH